MAEARALEIFRLLNREYPEARCSLDFKSPYQLLVATVLSAQCTDERVNRVTPALFARFGTADKMAAASLKEIEKLIRSTGFFRSKALALKKSAQDIVKKYEGHVPQEMDQLIALRGVGRKTANVILGNGFGIPGFPVDTHVGRLSRRMGFTRSQDPVKIEHELMKLLPAKDWTLFSHLLIYHGREICTARKAMCDRCVVNRLCPKIGVRT